MASNPLARYADPSPPPTPPRNPLARYAKSEKKEREVPAPPAGSGRAVQRAVRNAEYRAEYRRAEARRQKALKALQSAKDLDREDAERKREEIKRDRERHERQSKETPEQRKKRYDAVRERQDRLREKQRKIEKEQWNSVKLDRSNDPDPFDRPQRTMKDDLDYRTHKAAGDIKRGGPEPQRLAKMIRAGARVGSLAARAVPVAGTVVAAMDVANILGGPPTKDPSKFRDYKGIPGTVKPPKVKK